MRASRGRDHVPRELPEGSTLDKVTERSSRSSIGQSDPSKSLGNHKEFGPGGHLVDTGSSATGANRLPTATDDGGLELVIRAWPELASEVRGTIVEVAAALIRLARIPGNIGPHQIHYNRPSGKMEKGRAETAQIHNLLSNLYLHLKAGNFKDLARLVDVLKLHGFLPSFGAH
jgi:hypothetical protein